MDTPFETPYVEIDQAVMLRNLERMARHAAELGVRLRPHTKTHKIPELAKLQLQYGASGITVAKISEAEVMAEAGLDDIFIAYPLVAPSKIARALTLARSIKLVFGVDSLTGARHVAEVADQMGVQADLRLEVDTGLKRTGVAYDQALALAMAIRELKPLQLTGIYTYKGALLRGESTLDVRRAGAEEGELMAALASRLREAGIDIRDVSVGSTPTGLHAAAVPGVTEIRPGTYIFHDQMQVRIGSCGPEDCAARVIVTVVSVREDELAAVDGGSKTFATDVQPSALLNLRGFGAVQGYPDAVFERMNEEHGILRMNGPHGLKPGDRVAIVPNHICSTINLHDEVVVKDGGHYARLSVAGRGRVQ